MSIQRRDFCALAALGLASQAAFAQEWPAKQPIRIVVPYPAGGNADSSARALAEAVSGNLKQTILIDNRPGASSIIGTEAVARAPADGYTLGVVSDSHAINQAMSKSPKAADILFYSFCEWILYWEDPHTVEMGSRMDWASTMVTGTIREASSVTCQS